MDASAFIIRELSGQRRSVELNGRGLPHRPYSLATVQRVNVDWYAGLSIATATVLGPGEDPTTIAGAWQDKFIGRPPQSGAPWSITVDGAPVLSVRDAVDLFDDITRQGQLLEVSWDMSTRQGHLSRFEKHYNNVHDAAWAMHFEWISRGEPLPAAVFSAEASLADASSAYEVLFEDLLAIRTPGFAMARSYENRIANAIENIGQAVTDVALANESVAMRAITPSEASRRVVAESQRIQRQAIELVAAVEAEPYGMISSQPLPQQRFGTRIRAAIYARQVTALARRLRMEATERWERFVAELDRELLARHSGMEGEHLREVSLHYYGTPNEWQRLAQFNFLPDPFLAAGQVVLIPRAARGRVS